MPFMRIYQIVIFYINPETGHVVLKPMDLKLPKGIRAYVFLV